MTRPGPRRNAPAVAASAATVAFGLMTVALGATPAGATTLPDAGIVAHVAPLNLVNEWSLNLSPSIQLQSPLQLFSANSYTSVQASYDPASNDLLTLTWPGTTLQLTGNGPITPGRTYTDQTSLTGTTTCSGQGSFSAVQVDQFALGPTGQPTSVALQFDCIELGATPNTFPAFAFGTAAFGALPGPPGQGYYLYGPDGSLSAFGNDEYLDYLGMLGLTQLNQPIVSAAPTPTSAGYWMAASDGGIFAFGDAPYDGSMGGHPLNEPIAGMAPTPDGQGYWLVASDGGIFAFGDAAFYGSTGGLRLNQPIVGMAPTPDGHGYWLVAADGGIFAFGDAGFYGSTGALVLNQPVVGMAASPDGHGYWLAASDGGVFSFGDAGFHGSTGSLVLASPMVGITASPDGNGYWMAGGDGGVFAFGDAPFDGSAAGGPGGPLFNGLSSGGSSSTGVGVSFFSSGPLTTGLFP